ncbi:Acyl-coenzyme A oxidase 2, partial [Blastosporella zonata]
MDQWAPRNAPSFPDNRFCMILKSRARLGHSGIIPIIVCITAVFRDIDVDPSLQQHNIAMGSEELWLFTISLTLTDLIDGINVKSLVVDSIQIFAGQRYSFVLTANQPIKNYWIRAQPNIGKSTTFDGGLNSAILRYLLAPNSDPTTTQTPSSNPMLETNLHPLTNSAAPGRPVAGGADVAINLAISLNFTEFLFTINGASFIPPTAPVLLQLLSGAQTAQELLPPGSVYVLPPNKVIEVSIPGGTIGAP